MNHAPSLPRRAARAATIAFAFATLGLLGAGCATAPVRPWDRDLLSQKQMSFVPSTTEHDVDDHVYFSKEGSAGGQNVGGGGCGCN